MRRCHNRKHENSRAMQGLPPLLGERAGVRASVSSNLIFGVGGGFWREKHFRLRDAPPSPLRYDAIAPKPEAKAEKRRFGAKAVRLVTSAATALAMILELTLRQPATSQFFLRCHG